MAIPLYATGSLSPTAQLKATITSPKKPTVKKFNWFTSNKKIATVNKKGVVAAKKAGNAKITVTSADGHERRNLDWEKQFELAIDPEKARRYRAESTPEREDTCTMCGKMCAVRNINKILRGENVDIMD